MGDVAMLQGTSALASALACGGENLFGSVALLESFDLAPQNNGQAKITLSGFVNQLATLYDASFRQRLEQRKLAIVQFREGDAFRVAIELFVPMFVGCHFKTLRPQPLVRSMDIL